MNLFKSVIISVIFATIACSSVFSMMIENEVKSNQQLDEQTVLTLKKLIKEHNVPSETEKTLISAVKACFAAGLSSYFVYDATYSLERFIKSEGFGSETFWLLCSFIGISLAIEFWRLMLQNIRIAVEPATN